MASADQECNFSQKLIKKNQSPPHKIIAYYFYYYKSHVSIYSAAGIVLGVNASLSKTDELALFPDIYTQEYSDFILRND